MSDIVGAAFALRNGLIYRVMGHDICTSHGRELRRVPNTVHVQECPAATCPLTVTYEAEAAVWRA